MENRSTVFENGPLDLLHKIVGSYSSDTGIDRRLTVTVHTTSKSWTGVPTQFASNRTGEFFVFSFKDKPQALALAASQIIAVEVENPAALELYFSKPWARNGGFATISKLQAKRDLASLWGEEVPKVVVHFDSFPTTDDAPGFAVGWMGLLKTEFAKIRKEFGDKELAALSGVEVKFAKGDLTVVKTDGILQITIDMSGDSMDTSTIASRLSDAL